MFSTTQCQCAALRDKNAQLFVKENVNEKADGTKEYTPQTFKFNADDPCYFQASIAFGGLLYNREDNVTFRKRADAEQYAHTLDWEAMDKTFIEIKMVKSPPDAKVLFQHSYRPDSSNVLRELKEIDASNPVARFLNYELIYARTSMGGEFEFEYQLVTDEQKEREDTS